MLYLKKDPIVEGDLVLIHIDAKAAFYGRVEEITADVKPKWWQVKFLFLTIPAQVATWIMDEEQIRGADFTMGGTPIRIEKVVVPEDAAAPPEEKTTSAEANAGSGKQATVLAFRQKEE